MFRVWKGIELEGFDKGIFTLFVASDDTIDENVVIGLLKEHDIHRVYLGAGRTSFSGFVNADNFIDYCINNDVKIIIEVNAAEILSVPENTIIEQDVVTTIYSFRVKNANKVVKKNALFKYDDYNQVVVFKDNEFSYTDLATLDGMTFQSDIVLVNN